MRRFLLGALGASLVGLALAPACTLEPLPGAGGGGAGGDGPYRPTAAIDIRRDEHGVVHVNGKSDGDVFYGAGYMQANDRLLQMELQKRRAAGRLAEILGQDSFDDDRIVRTIGIPKLGHDNAEAMKAMHPDAYALAEAWVAGVNARIAEVTSGAAPMPTGFAELGFQPEPWTVDDTFAIGKLIVFGNGDQLEFDALATLIHRLDPELYAELVFYRPLEDAFILDVATREGKASLGKKPAPAARDHGARPALDPALRDELRAFFRKLRHVHPGASNNFAVLGTNTDDGHSMIAGDPHQSLRSPSLMWMSHLDSADQGGTFDVEGWCFVGTPGVSLGHNRDIAWTATTNYPDVTDIWDVPFDGQGHATIGGTQVDVDSHDETIAIKGDSPVTITIDAIPGYGVFLPDDLFPIPLASSGRRVLYGWTGFRVTNEARAFLDIQRAKNLDDFDAAVDEMELGSFNFVGASRDAISYRSSPLVPDRGDPKTHPPAYEMLDGTDPNTFWTNGFLPLEKMPHSRATASGMIVTANNDPFGFTKAGSLADAPYYFGAYFDPGLRASRIASDLQGVLATRKITADDMKATQLDIHSLLADELLGDLATSYAKVPTDDALVAYRNRPDLDALAAMLAGWDRRMARDEAAPVAFEAFMYFLVRDILSDDMGPFFDPVMGQEPIYLIKFALLALRDGSSPLVQNGNDLALLGALDETAQFLIARYGSTTTGFLWKDFHETAFPSESIPAFDGGAVPTDGGEGTVDVSSGTFFDDSGDVAEHHVSDQGSIYRMIATFDDAGLPHAKFQFARGNAGEPNDPHYDDLTDDWANGRYRDMYFEDADVEAHTTERKTLGP